MNCESNELDDIDTNVEDSRDLWEKWRKINWVFIL